MYNEVWQSIITADAVYSLHRHRCLRSTTVCLCVRPSVRLSIINVSAWPIRMRTAELGRQATWVGWCVWWGEGDVCGPMQCCYHCGHLPVCMASSWRLASPARPSSQCLQCWLQSRRRQLKPMLHRRQHIVCLMCCNRIQRSAHEPLNKLFIKFLLEIKMHKIHVVHDTKIELAALTACENDRCCFIVCLVKIH